MDLNDYDANAGSSIVKKYPTLVIQADNGRVHYTCERRSGEIWGELVYFPLTFAVNLKLM